MADFKTNNIIIPAELPLIALKNTVLFPKVVIPLIVQRPKSVAALEDALAHERLVFFVTQRNIEDNIGQKDVFMTGTIGRIVSVFKLPDGSSKIDVEGLVRGRIIDFISEEPIFSVKFEPLLPRQDTGENLADKALVRLVIDQFRTVSELRAISSVSPEIIYVMSQLKDVDQLISLITVNIGLEVQDQQIMLETENPVEALKKLN